MSDIDDQLADEVNNALAAEDADAAADNDQDDIAEDDDPDSAEADEEEADDDADSDSDDDDAPGKGKDGAAGAGQDDPEDDDDPAIDYARPAFPKGSTQAQPFDVRTLPKDPDTGLIDPVKANELIEAHYAKQTDASVESERQLRETEKLLTTQWSRVARKYPTVYGNQKLRELARNMHLSSIGTDQYLTPAQAAARVDRIRKDLVGKVYKSAKTRKTVENMARSERGSGGKGTTGKLSEYEKAKKLAQSDNPQYASVGRQRMMALRREARNRR